jgi:selenide,water dikinase
VLSGLPRDADPRLVVGMEHPDDAAVFRMPGGDLLIQTVDLIAPIVNDPRAFGMIAAANSLSDVYAMGGRALTAMNVLCFPAKLPYSVLGEILDGAVDRMKEAGCLLVGGHTVVDPELKFGLSVSGVVEGGAVYSIDKARVGDVLLLTKPIGTGIVNQALRKAKLDDSSPSYQAAVRSMIALNASAATAARAAGASSLTDVTGFGLLGHSAQFARASKATFEIHADSVPEIEGARALVAAGAIPKRAGENADSYRERVTGLRSEEDAIFLFDPQTSGGMLACVPEDGVATFVSAMKGWQHGVATIGRVVAASGHDVVVR